ncbi:hypothetical protein AXF13_07145 [Desulfovibrio fairfieldensis]|uniref:Uncharacterized protein n=1 Tax=Desulfovibrio fairfieldensis TaxID=44742 RepID=A0A0X8JJF8_9BACT|nr:hypothetical protein AXF13_07145 [Desulfovibrio fairfieldensis]
MIMRRNIVSYGAIHVAELLRECARSKKFNIFVFVSSSQKYSKHGFIIKKILQTVFGTFMMQIFFL